MIDAWTSGDAYEVYMGRWSRAVAREFLPWLVLPSRQRCLDLGCGTGALTAELLETISPAGIVALDPATAYVSFARGRVSDDRVRFVSGTAVCLPFGARSFDAVVSGLALNFVSDVEAALAEMRRVTSDGGVVAAYVWDYADGMEPLRRFWDAAMSLDRAAQDLDEGRRFPLCQSEALASRLHAAGLRDIQMRAIDVPARFASFEDYWAPFLGGQGPAPAYIRSLSEARRDALRDRLLATVPISPNGTIDMTARAWAARGLR